MQMRTSSELFMKIVFVLFLALLSAVNSAVAQERRVALVIGIADYQTVPKLILSLFIYISLRGKDLAVNLLNYTHRSVVMGLTADWLLVEGVNCARDYILRARMRCRKKNI